MGAWFRMKADFDISGYSAETRVILTAFKVHGLVVADKGRTGTSAARPTTAGTKACSTS